ncbi:putative addiction module component [Novipirellula aureliae]|uniref:Putative addiction module component n=2 Tax=Novipirellula aureliae TaxID=2527966 RepID=A0A5C6DR42_9BACT|nr:putative addiction module component [Novipirellula aureliae]
MSQMELPSEILNMSAVDRLQLIGRIWDSINDDGPPPISDSQREILDKRLAAFEADPNKGESWDQVRSELFGDE